VDFVRSVPITGPESDSRMDSTEPGLPTVVRTVMAKARGLFTSLHEAAGGDEILRRAASVLTQTGEDFLPAVVREVADMLDAELAFVGELTGPDRLRSVASWQNGAAGESIEYVLPGSPLEHTSDRSIRSYYSCVRVHFPDDVLLPALDADGYIALPLIGTRDEVIGAIVAITRRPLNNEAGAKSLLQLLAGRVAAELERARTERELRKSEHHLLQVQRVEAIGWLAGNIAHDFNNLLMIVIGYAEILQDRANSQELSELLAASRRASTLTKQLLAFGRRQVMQVQRVDINRVVSQVQTMLARVLGSEIRLSTTLDPSIPSVEVDPGQLEQVLVNLAINARDAMPNGGSLKVETTVVEVTRPYFQMPVGRYVRLSVTDTGVGMPPEVLSQIFEPFFTTKGNRGTGLGLSSVYGIVKQSGGYIWCDSTPGQGTTFTIYLKPAAGVADDESQLAPTQERAAGGDERVLVVDDEPAVRRLLARILRSRGYDVFETEDAPSALAFMSTANRPMDLVVTDIVMPSMSGVRLAEQIKAQWPSVKILFVSGFPADEAIPASELASVPLLGKPFTPDEIETKVRELLDKRA
jgi:signal transduction histidine kinase/ActR/RegA family two-component response regulator